jgi:hypothetical protein
MTTTLWLSLAVVVALSVTFVLRRRFRRKGLLGVSQATRLIEYDALPNPRPLLDEYMKSRTKE